MKKNLLIKTISVLCIILLFSMVEIQAQTPVWTLDFESAGGYSTSITEFTDAYYDYFLRTDGSDIGTAVEFLNVQGSYYFTAQDIDAEGETLPVEVVPMYGKSKLTLTGSLGDVMQESAMAALSYIRKNRIKFGLDAEFYDKLELHVHIPEGAVPKDGPSAGITLATALISLLTNQPIRRDVAMTGEITLRGRVLGVGGLKEKAMAAHRAGIKIFVLPKQNEKDMVDIPTKVRRDMAFVFVESMPQVLEHALQPADTD